MPFLNNNINRKFKNFSYQKAKKFNEIFEDGETPEFSGKVVVQLAQDPDIMKYTSKVVLSAEYAQRFGLKDIDGRVIPSVRQMNFILSKYVLPQQLKFLTCFIPGFIKLPYFVFDLLSSKY